MSTAPRRPPDDAGTATIELALLGPVLVLVMLAIGACGLLATAHQSVQAAAASAARAASISRTETTAQTAAQDAALQALSDEHLRCASTDIEVDTTGFAVPVGQPAAVTADVTCHLDLAALVGIGATPAISAQVTSPIDTYRER